ncbi:MAG: tyrosine-type recombinase/integrase [Pseudomonadota bacterium]|nr:tyrosine-type recombinase/integrase [Pseudomonadota bacterium]
MGRSFNGNFENYLFVQRVADKTRKAYLQSVQGLELFHEQPAENLSNEQIQDYLIYCIQEKELAWSSCNVLFCGLKKYYSGYLGCDESEFSIPPRPRSRQLPMLLSPREVQSILLATGNLKHKSLLAIIYGSGLRVSEAVNLEPHHIESNRMMVRIEQSKGRKDRYTVLSQKSLDLLREYWRNYRPGKWLFFGRDKNVPMSIATAQRIFYNAKEKAGVTKGRGIHTLRHCFASHALEQGVEMYIIKRWLGHTSIRTTCGYLHLSPSHLAKVKSPLDDLYSEVTP